MTVSILRTKKFLIERSKFATGTRKVHLMGKNEELLKPRIRNLYNNKRNFFLEGCQLISDDANEVFEDAVRA